MTLAKSHSQFRRCVCAICFLENGLKASRRVSREEEKVIQENICDDFSLNNEKYATGLCVECHFALRRLKTKEADSILRQAIGLTDRQCLKSAKFDRFDR